LNKNDIKKMDLADRLQTMEAIWDSFLDDEAALESPEWHHDILEERKRKIESGKAEFISLKVLKASRKS
jgi:hypothetical protein